MRALWEQDRFHSRITIAQPETQRQLNSFVSIGWRSNPSSIGWRNNESFSPLSDSHFLKKVRSYDSRTDSNQSRVGCPLKSRYLGLKMQCNLSSSTNHRWQTSWSRMGRMCSNSNWHALLISSDVGWSLNSWNQLGLMLIVKFLKSTWLNHPTSRSIRPIPKIRLKIRPSNTRETKKILIIVSNDFNHCYRKCRAKLTVWDHENLRQNFKLPNFR